MSEVFPPGVINVVHGDGEVGTALTHAPAGTQGRLHRRHRDGAEGREAAAGTIKNVTLELGGNDPAVVLDDVDIDATLDRMLKGVSPGPGRSASRSSGSTCPARCTTRFADAFCERVNQYAVGHGLDPRVELRAAEQREPSSRRSAI